MFWRQSQGIFLGVIAALCAGALFFLLAEPQNVVHAGASQNIFGWAWSETAGWVSFNSSNCDADNDGVSNGIPAGCPPSGTSIANYGVTMDPTTGVLSGYAWSENTGWISFSTADLIGCPSGACEARISVNGPSMGAVSGWARACAGTLAGDCASGTRTDGWDGWIRLRNDSDGDGIVNTDTNADYGVFVNDCAWDGWAWGSDVIGWVHMKGSGYGVQGSGAGCLAKPDLVVSVVPSLNSGALVVGNAVTFKGTVRNQGVAAASSFTNRFTVDIGNNGTDDVTLSPDYPISALSVDSAQEVFSGTWSNIPGGAHRATLCADSAFVIAELDETNNCASWVFTVVPAQPPVCSDGVDNDGDGLIDY